MQLIDMTEGAPYKLTYLLTYLLTYIVTLECIFQHVKGAISPPSTLGPVIAQNC